MSKKQQRMMGAGGLLLVGMAAILFFVWRARVQEIQQRKVEYYEDTMRLPLDVSGPPIAQVLTDRGEPAPRVIIGMTLIGPDGGDGGSLSFVTDEAGIAYHNSRLSPGRYQYHLIPDPKSRFAHTAWRRGQPYIIISDDGTTSFPQLRLNVKSTES